jgi:hypothetical protein
MSREGREVKMQRAEIDIGCSGLSGRTWHDRLVGAIFTPESTSGSDPNRAKVGDSVPRVSIHAVAALLMLSLFAASAHAQTPIFPQAKIIAILEQTASDCQRQWKAAHGPTNEKYDYIIEAVKRLYVASAGTVGGNWRRVVIGDLSMDGLTVDMREPNGTIQRYFADVIAGAGGTNPRIVFNVTGLLRNSAGQYAPEGFAAPNHPRFPAAVVGCGGTPTIPVEPVDPVCPICPPIPPKQSYPDEPTFWREYELQVVALYQRAFDEGKRGSPDLDSAAFRWFARPAYDIGSGVTKEAAVAGHLAALARALGLQP